MANKEVFDVKTGISTVSAMTPEEETQLAADGARHAQKLADREAEAIQKANDQASGNAKLLGLGLSQDEATALTGYTPPIE